MWGSATFTIVASSTTMSWAVAMTTRARPRWRRTGPASAPPAAARTVAGCVVLMGSPCQGMRIRARGGDATCGRSGKGRSAATRPLPGRAARRRATARLAVTLAWVSCASARRAQAVSFMTQTRCTSTPGFAAGGLPGLGAGAPDAAGRRVVVVVAGVVVLAGPRICQWGCLRAEEVPGAEAGPRAGRAEGERAGPQARQRAAGGVCHHAIQSSVVNHSYLDSARLYFFRQLFMLESSP